LAEKLYEGMFLLDSGRFASNPQGAVDEVVGMLEKSGASVSIHRAWQEGRLAYPIAGQGKGLYYLTFFRMEGQGTQQIARACKLSDLVLRHMIIRHPQVLFDAMVNALNGESDLIPHDATLQDDGAKPPDTELDSTDDGDEDSDELDESDESDKSDDDA